MVTVANVLTNLGWYLSFNITLWQWQLAAIVSFIGLVAIQIYRSLPIQAAAAISLMVLAAALFANALTSCQLPPKGVHFEAFSGFRLAAIAIAIIAPTPVWMGWFIIGCCALVPTATYFLIMSPELQIVFSAQEPWISLIYAVVAFFVLRHRLKAIELERTIERMASERRALADLAHLFLGLRDLTNTPLQSIELTAGLLGTNNLTPTEAAAQLERSMIQLRELSQILTAYEMDIDWSHTASSFDATVLLQSKIDEIKLRF